MPFDHKKLTPDELMTALKSIPAGYTFEWGPTFARIGFNELAFDDPKPTKAIVRVLVHELAHVAGAPGRQETTDKSLARRDRAGEVRAGEREGPQ
jgi:hypothetical protein